MSRVSGLAHVPNERLPCVQQVLTIHLLFRIILQYTAVFQPRVPSLFRGTRNLIPTDPENLRIFSDVVASVGLRGSCGAQAKGQMRRGDFRGGAFDRADLADAQEGTEINPVGTLIEVALEGFSGKT